MKLSSRWSLALLAVAFLAATSLTEASALLRRQYYSGWTYYPQRTYHYSYYYYKPYPSYTSYNYHYCIYYPSEPSYVYYYNPYKEVYWGRLDMTAKGENRYSLLADKDQKKVLKDIPASAFPKPGPMPAIPESEDGQAIEPVTQLPAR